MSETNIRGGDKWKQVIAKIASQKASLRVGILEKATYSGEGNSEAGTPVAPIAAAQEFGTKDIPARPFMRNTVGDKKSSWANQIARLLRGKPDRVHDAFEIMGDIMAKDIQQTIEKGVMPWLNDKTIARKRKRGKKNPEKTLIDTGTMQEAISYEVVR